MIFQTLYSRLPGTIRFHIFESRLWLAFIKSCIEAKTTDSKEPAQTTNYVISKRITGLGDCLISLMSAWRYARDTGRTLVIDWRHSCYLQEPATNLFPLLFRPLAQIGSVPIVCDQSINRQNFPHPIFPPEWTAQNIHSKRPIDNSYLTRVLVKYINLQRHIRARSIVLHGCMFFARPLEEECRFFLSHLIPVPDVSRQIQEFRTMHFRSQPVIGIHIRHGNGGNIMAHTPYWEDSNVALNHCQQQIQAARDKLGNNAVIFLCTDSLEVESFIKAQFPNVLVREKAFRPPGEGELHLGHLGLQTAQDALIELLLLSYSTVLLKYPPDSFFSFYASLFHQHPKLHLSH